VEAYPEIEKTDPPGRGSHRRQQTIRDPMTAAIALHFQVDWLAQGIRIDAEAVPLDIGVVRSVWNYMIINDFPGFIPKRSGTNGALKGAGSDSEP
jgi:hypothetical protein